MPPPNFTSRFQKKGGTQWRAWDRAGPADATGDRSAFASVTIDCLYRIPTVRRWVLGFSEVLPPWTQTG
jgi:hypothetical protein